MTSLQSCYTSPAATYSSSVSLNATKTKNVQPASQNETKANEKNVTVYLADTYEPSNADKETINAFYKDSFRVTSDTPIKSGIMTVNGETRVFVNKDESMTQEDVEAAVARMTKFATQVTASLVMDKKSKEIGFDINANPTTAKEKLAYNNTVK